MTAPELTDAEVRVLLKDFNVDPNAAGANDKATRLKLLVLVLGKVQALSSVVAKHGAAAKLNPAALPQLQSRKLCAEQFDINTLFSIQEKFLDGGSYSAWFELRRTLCEFVASYATKHTSRLYLTAAGRGGGTGIIDIVGTRQAGELPLLEMRCMFQTTPMPRDFAAAEVALRPSGAESCITAPVQPGELKLASALLHANAAVLSPEYVAAQQAAWGQHGGLFQVSCLLPIEPLKADVRLPKTCQVCGKEGAKACSRCKEVAYCGKDCQTQDWKRHKAECVVPEAAASASEASSRSAASSGSAAAASSSSSSSSSSSNSPSVMIKISAQSGIAPFQMVMPFNMSHKQMKKASKKGPQWSDGNAPPVERPADASKKFLVKIQAPMGGPSSMPLLLYDEKRKVMTQVAKAEQAHGAYDHLLSAIRSKGYMGAKLYLHAVLEQEGSLRVLLEPLPSQTHNGGELHSTTG